MNSPHKRPVAAWLWRGALAGLALTLVATAALAAVLALGLATPRPAGALQWQQDFKTEADGWIWLPPPGGRLAPEDGALVAAFARDQPRQAAVALTGDPGADFTLEAAGAAEAGRAAEAALAAEVPGSAAYGVVFAWQDERHYSAVLVNGNGYAQAYRQSGDEREEWFEWQQWPHILAGESSNRIRVDVQGPDVTVRINDELLVVAAGGGPAGMIGVVAHSDQPARVIFSWVRLWAAAETKAPGH